MTGVLERVVRPRRSSRSPGASRGRAGGPGRGRSRSRPRQREVVLPRPDEPIVEAERAGLVEAARNGSATPAVSDVVGPDVGRPRGRAAACGGASARWRPATGQSTREDVGLDPVGAATLGLEGDVGEGDDLEAARPPGRGRDRPPRSRPRSTRRRPPPASRSIRPRRTCPVDVAVVAQLDVDAVGQPGARTRSRRQRRAAPSRP